jgi:hypothetical protein
MKGPAESGKICSVGVEIVVVAGCSTGRSAEPFRQLRRDDAAGAGARIGIKSGCRLTAISYELKNIFRADSAAVI